VFLSKLKILPAPAVRSYLVLRKIIGRSDSSENLNPSGDKVKVSTTSVKDYTRPFFHP
jgi:hypothetical protein